MAKLKVLSSYDKTSEVPLGSISPGHTVALLSPQGDVAYYTVAKIGSTDLVSTNSERKTVPLLNHITGRLVLKDVRQRVVLVSATVEIRNYHGAFKDAKR